MARDPYAKYTFCEECMFQAIYLYRTMTASEVAAITGYAKSTVRNYASKYSYRLPEAIAFFEDSPEEVIPPTVYTPPAESHYRSATICWLGDTRDKDKYDEEKAYLFRFFENAEDDTPIFSKIGTTLKSCLDRLKDEIRYYEKAGFTISKVEICEIWNCGETPAESYESYLRALLIKKYPNTWHRNDRFFGVHLPAELFTKLCRQYSEL